MAPDLIDLDQLAWLMRVPRETVRRWHQRYGLRRHRSSRSGPGGACLYALASVGTLIRTLLEKRCLKRYGIEEVAVRALLRGGRLHAATLLAKVEAVRGEPAPGRELIWSGGASQLFRKWARACERLAVGEGQVQELADEITAWLARAQLGAGVLKMVRACLEDLQDAGPDGLNEIAVDLCELAGEVAEGGAA